MSAFEKRKERERGTHKSLPLTSRKRNSSFSKHAMFSLRKLVEILTKTTGVNDSFEGLLVVRLIEKNICEGGSRVNRREEWEEKDRVVNSLDRKVPG